jgi:YidC/Oxa1 family membrane protein insertase
MQFLITFFNLFKILKNQNIIYLFYSEGKVYQNNFYDFIFELNKNFNGSIYYVSSEIQDAININGVTNFYIGNGLARLFFFNYIKCKFFFTTLTDLGNYYLKKSDRVGKYVYIFHSPISLHRSYTPKAFNNYDIFFSIGKKHTEELIKIFKNNNLKNKNIENIGYFYFDFLKKSTQSNNVEKNTILVAPSWNYDSKNFLNTDCEKLLECLLKNEYKVIFRPHPEHYKRNKNTLQKIKKIFLNSKNFIFDNNSSNLEAIKKSEILITDNSGIAIEFCMIFKRPIFYFESNLKLHNKNHFLVSDITIEDVIRNKFGKSIKISDLSKIKGLINKQKKYFNHTLIKQLNTFVDKYFYNYGKSANKAVQFLTNIEK